VHTVDRGLWDPMIPYTRMSLENEIEDLCGPGIDVKQYFPLCL